MITGQKRTITLDSLKITLFKHVKIIEMNFLISSSKGCVYLNSGRCIKDFKTRVFTALLRKKIVGIAAYSEVNKRQTSPHLAIIEPPTLTVGSSTGVHRHVADFAWKLLMRMSQFD
uniref:Uncharacterized protein n=1 Tax=Romanomermis culicivorax TaxID=13658 RepID=A0A915KC19_ROMCU